MHISKLFILGLNPDKYQTIKVIIPLNLCLQFAKTVVSLSGKQSSQPKFIDWIKELSLTLPLEKITHFIKDKLSLFESIWCPFIQYMEKVDLSNMINMADEV